MQINKILPEDRKIRVISISYSWRTKDLGYKDLSETIEEVKAAGILIVSTSFEETYGFKFHGLDRPPLRDPNAFESYEPGLWWAQDYYSKEQVNDKLMIPMGSRTTAAPTGISDYAFNREGGWSWVVPYIAGVYALAAQVVPEITPEKFWDVAMKTGKNNSIETRRKGN